MKRTRLARAVPVAIAAVATSIPVVTMVDMIGHAAKPIAKPHALVFSSSPVSTPVPTPVPRRHRQHDVRHRIRRHHGAPTLSRTYAGAAVTEVYGTVEATIKVRGGRLTGVSISAPMTDPRAIQVNGTAIPIIQSETLSAQSANVAVVSGATQTSQAFIQSLQSALSRARR